MIPRVFIFILFLELMVKKKTWMKAISVTVMVIISKVLFCKLFDHSYIQSSFSTITRHIDRHLTVEDFTDMDQHM